MPRETAARRPLIRLQTRFSPLPLLLSDNETRHYHGSSPITSISRDPLIVPISRPSLSRESIFSQKFYHEFFSADQSRVYESMMKDTLSFFRGKRERGRERVLISSGSANLRFSFLSSRGRGGRVLGFRWRKCLSLGCDPTTSWIHEIARLAASTIAGRTINVPGYSAIICYRLSSSPIELRPYYYRTGAFLTLDYFCQGQNVPP